MLTAKDYLQWTETRREGPLLQRLRREIDQQIRTAKGHLDDSTAA